MSNFPATLSNAQRTALKAAIAAHADCKTALAAHGLRTTGEMRKEHYAPICNALQIDTGAVLGALPLEMVQDEPETPEALVAAPEGVLEAVDIVAPFEAVLHPSIASTLRAGIASVRAQAEQEIEKARREARKAAVATVHTAPAASRSGMSTLGKVFGVRGQWASIPVQTWAPCVDTPAIDPEYIFNAETLGLVMSALDRGDFSWVYGAKGAGKTELARQIAARTGRPFVRIPFAADMDKYALLGQRIPGTSGAFEWKDGILAQAIRKAGCVILLDEPSMAQPGLLALLQTTLDLRALSIEDTGESVTFADGVAIIAADNTDGFGDSTGRYHGTGQMNEAFLDRFARKVSAQTPTRETLGKIISGRTGLAIGAALVLADLIRNSEAAAATGDKLSTHLSLRPVLAFARDVQAGLPLQACLDATLLSSLPSGEAQQLRQHVLAHLDLKALHALAHPGSVSALDMSPAASQAVDDFTSSATASL